MIRRTIKWIAIACGAVFVLLILVLAGIRFYAGTDAAHKTLQKRINAAIPGTVTWDDLDFSLSRGRIELEGVLLQGPEGESLIAADRLFLNLSWTSLPETLQIDTIEVAGPKVWLAMDASGTLNLMKAFPAPAEDKPEDTGGGLPFNIRVDRLTLTDGLVEYRMDNTETAERLLLNEIRLAAQSFDLKEQTIDLDLQIGGGEVDMAGIQTPLDSFQLSAVLKEDRIAPVRLDLQTGETVLALSGEADHLFDAPALDLELAIAADLKDIRETLHLGIDISGPVKATVNARGTREKPAVDLVLDYEGGTLAGIPVNWLHLETGLEDRTVKVETLQVDSEMTDLVLTGTVDLASAFENGLFAAPTDLTALSYQLTLNPAQTRLARIPGTTDILEGTAGGTITVAGQGISPETLSAVATIDLTAEELAIRNVLEPVPLHLSAEAALDGGTATVRQLTATIPDTAELELTGTYDLSEQETDAALKLTAEELETFLSRFGVAGFAGQAVLQADLKGPVAQPAIDARLEGQDVRFQDIRLGRVGLDAVMNTDGDIQIDELTLEREGSRLRLAGLLDLFDRGWQYNADLPADLTLTLTEANPADFLPELGLRGTIDGTIQVSEQIMAPRAHIDLQVEALAMKETRIGDVTADLRLDDGTVTLSPVTLHNGQSDLKLSGTATIFPPDSLKPLENPAFDLSVDEGELYLSDFADTFSGKLLLAGQIQGRRNNPTARLTVEGENLAAAENRIGDLTARLGWTDGILQLETVQVQNGQSEVAASGTARLLDPETFQPLDHPAFDVALEGRLFLQDFVPEMKGRLTLDGAVQGTTEQLQGTVAVKGNELDLGGQTIDGLTLNSRLDGEKVYMEPLLIAMAPDQTIRTDGWISLGRRYDLRVRSDGIAFDQINALKDQNISGNISFTLAGTGSLENPGLNGVVEINGIRVNRETLQDLRIQVEVADQVARIDGALNFDLAGQYHLETKDFSFSARFDDTELGPYFRAAGREDLSGRMTGTVKATGNAARPEAIEAVADIAGLRIALNDTELLRARPFEAALEDGQVVIPGIRLVLLEQGELNLQGSGRLDGRLSLQADGQIPVAVARLFVPELSDPTGALTLNARLEGTLERPDIRAEVGLDRIGLVVPVLGQRLQNLNGGIVLTPDSAVLENVTGRLDDGRFALNGKIDLKQFQPRQANVTFTANTLPVEVPGMLSLLLNADLALRGTLKQSAVTGEIVLLEGEYYKDVKLNLLQKVSRIGQRKRDVKPESTEPASPVLENMRLDITVIPRNSFVVDNNIALLMVKPDLRIHGTAAQPLVNGRAEVVSGSIHYQQKEFDVRKGVIDFLNPYRIEPTIDIRAVTDIRQWTIILDISGTPDNLKLELSSDPSEEDADILSLLTLGKTLGELAEREGGGTGLRPEQILADMVAKTLQENVKKATGLDIVEFKYRQQDSEEESDEVKVTLGKELSRRLTVKYGMEKKSGEVVQSATTEYKFLENLLFKAYQDTQGDFGGELQFRIEFR